MKPIAKFSQIKENEPTFVDVGDGIIGLYRFKDRIFAYRNVCPHEGGPVTEGEIMGNVECLVSDGRRLEQHVSKDNVNIVCPWHGIEYDIETGKCRASPYLHLSKFEIEVDGDQILAKTENPSKP